jgi:transglutaminase-like putative cysteine protease
MTLWERVVQANRPGPPEHSVQFRVAATLAVVVAVAACWSQGELAPPMAAFAIVATVVGNVLSFWRRERPWAVVKPILAVCVIAGFVWFAVTVTHNANPGDIATVEQPLAALFAWVLATHAFDVPARRDVAYSLAGSAALMAVAAAQTVDLSLAGYVVAWVACGVWGLVAMWKSMAGARGAPWVSLLVAGVVVAVLTVGFVAVLPAPHVSTSLIFPSSSAGDAPVNSASGLSDGPSLPAHAASPSGPTRVGGYLGFAKSLDTGARGALSDQVVMRVRASRPGYWVGQTYDYWDGQSWTQRDAPAKGKGVRQLSTGSPFTIPLTSDQAADLAPDTPDVQTFYLAVGGPNLVFHTDNAQRVYLESQHLFLTGDGTIVSSTSMGAGTVYTVVSGDNTGTAAELRQSTVPPASGQAQGALTPDQVARYTQLPAIDPRVAALARQIAGGPVVPDQDPHTYDKVEAIEAWMADHIHYSTDIPPLKPGQDAVSTFLFGTRIGYCEQISTATTVMLRSLGIPAREAVGYVPGSYNPITDLYQVEAKDAHAWVQVWFPGYGWQSFDPTADVPLANPSPGSVIAKSAANDLRHVPWIPLGVVAAAVVAVVVARRRRTSRPPTWAHRVAADLERAGARAGIDRRPDETLDAFCARLARAAPASQDALREAASTVERWAYGGMEPSAGEIADVTAFAHRFRVGRADQADVSASASSNEAPAASRGR